jgi:cytochrome c
MKGVKRRDLACKGLPLRTRGLRINHHKEEGMHRIPMVVAVALVAVLLLASLTYAAATKDEAKAWVKKAVEYYKTNGKEKALAEFVNPKGQFVKGDSYIYVFDLNAKLLAHPHLSVMVGQDFTKIKDPDGKPFPLDIIKEAKEKGSGWVDYRWENPVTKKVEPKTVYFEKVDDVVICSGAYTK